MGNSPKISLTPRPSPGGRGELNVARMVATFLRRFRDNTDEDNLCPHYDGIGELVAHTAA